MNKLIRIVALTGLATLAATSVAGDLKAFVSDGCSAFPEGTSEDQRLWLHCCTDHDYAYWQGGTYKARLAAESRWVNSFKHQSEARNITWRLHTSIWAAGAALKTGIDNSIFVECGTGRGFMATGIATYYDFEKSARPNFYLIDIFSSTLSDSNAHSSNPAEFAYTSDAIEVEDWFRKYPSIKVIQGFIPDCLAELPDKPISFLHVDLNSASAEESTLEALKARFRKGSIILFDDYGGFVGEDQALVHEAFAKDNNRELLIIPTGQALIVW